MMSETVPTHDAPPCVLVSHERFLECRDRRTRIAAELTQRDRQRTIEATVLSSPAEPVKIVEKVTP